MMDFNDHAVSDPQLDKLQQELPYNAQMVWEAVRERVAAQPHPDTRRYNGYDGQLWKGVLNEVVTEMWPALRDGTLDAGSSITLRRKLNAFLRNSNNLVCVNRGDLKNSHQPTWWVSGAWNPLVVTAGVTRVPPTALGDEDRDVESVVETSEEAPAELAEVEQATLANEIVRATVTPDGTTGYPCSKGCGTRISTASNLRNHERTCTGEPAQFECDWEDCGLKFTSPQGLGSHRRMHTGTATNKYTVIPPPETLTRGDDRPGHFYCDKGCGSWFGQAYKRDRHELTCDGNEASYVCPRRGCDRKYTSAQGLSSHLRHHDSVKAQEAAASKRDIVALDRVPLTLTELTDEQVQEKVLAVVRTAQQTQTPVTLTMLRLIPTGVSLDQRKRVVADLLLRGQLREVVCRDHMNRELNVYVTDEIPVETPVETTEAESDPVTRRREYVTMLQDLLRDYQELQGNTVTLDRVLEEKAALTRENQELQDRIEKARQAFGA
jgi:hypothetical protein